VFIEHHNKKKIARLIKDFREMFFASAAIKFGMAISILFLAMTLALPLWRIFPMTAEKNFIALHYNIYLGIDSFGEAWRIFTIPALGFFLLIANTLIQATTFAKQKTLAMFFCAATPLLEFVLLVAMFLIVLINI
jgi:hypothetical protein